MNDEFHQWLQNAKFCLPQLMTLAEARKLHERKLQDDETLKDRDKHTISQLKSRGQQ